MKSARIRLFCTLEELSDWLTLLCNKHGLGCIRFCGEDFGIITPPSELRLDDRTYACFLYPSCFPPPPRLAMNDVKQRMWGWIYVSRFASPLCDEKTMLFMSDIHGEDTEMVPASRYVRWLKAYLNRKSLIRAGVRGGIDLTLDWRMCSDIRYTEGARRLWEAGVPWKQYCDGTMYFGPAVLDHRVPVRSSGSESKERTDPSIK